MSRQYPYGKGPVKWVSTEWLMDHLGDENLVILDAQPDIHDYIQEHIPGARYMNERLLRLPLKGLPGEYIQPEVFQMLARRMGLRSEVPLVVYSGKGAFRGWGDGLEQTMMAYSLARFGHGNVLVLDGGIEQWKADGGRLSKEFPRYEESDFSVHVHREFFVRYVEFKAMKDREDVILLDARPKALYEGQGPWIRPGHIPGAVNLPWLDFMHHDNPRLLKTDEEITAILNGKGVKSDKAVVCSCGTGREATGLFPLLKWHLGFSRVVIYEGSFTEWTSYPENPTVTGPNPR